MSNTEYITAKVPANIKYALDAIAAQQRMQDGADIRRSALIREALLDYIEKEMSRSDAIRQAVEEVTDAADNNAG